MDKTLLNQLTNRLKKRLKEAQNTSFYEYVSSLNRYENSIWRPIKTASKPRQENPPISTQTPTPGPWARSNQEIADLFAEHLAEVFTPNDGALCKGDCLIRLCSNCWQIKSDTVQAQFLAPQKCKFQNNIRETILF